MTGCGTFLYPFAIVATSKAEAGIGISQGWCEQFAKGFACASTSILNYLIGQAGD